MRMIVIFILVSFMSGCTGYRIKDNVNPFAQYGIKSVAVPMFLNYSAVPNVNTFLTKEFYLMLSKFYGLKLYSSESKKADAILLGIVDSSKNLRNVFKERSHIYTSGDLKTSIGVNRKEFYLPRSVNWYLNLRVVLIKNPRPVDVKIAQSELSQYMHKNSKIIFNELIPINGSTNLVLFGNTPDEYGAQVNYTQSRKLIEKSIKQVAKANAIAFKERLIYAF